MAWKQLQLRVAPHEVQAVRNALLARGAASVVLRDHDGNPALELESGGSPWPFAQLNVLFDPQADQRSIVAELRAHWPALGKDVRWETLDEQSSDLGWLDQYAPIRCGDRLWICPSFHPPPEPYAVNLRMDPGRAFGSRPHTTTLLCLEWLERIDLRGVSVVDYGCGSGILGIAALLLGAEKVIAVDNDPQALRATRENLALNRLGDERLFACLPEDAPRTPADVVLANILAEPLMSLAPLLGDLVKAGGRLCLSGMTTAQVDPVRSCYSSFAFDAPSSREGWALIHWARLTACKAA